MTKLLEQAVAVARRLPPDEQDEIARLMLRVSPETRSLCRSRYYLMSGRRSRNSKAAAVRDEFASDQEVRATWAKHGM
jgi:hypothetical protein